MTVLAFDLLLGRGLEIGQQLGGSWWRFGSGARRLSRVLANPLLELRRYSC